MCIVMITVIVYSLMTIMTLHLLFQGKIIIIIVFQKLQIDFSVLNTFSHFLCFCGLETDASQILVSGFLLMDTYISKIYLKKTFFCPLCSCGYKMRTYPSGDGLGGTISCLFKESFSLMLHIFHMEVSVINAGYR